MERRSELASKREERAVRTEEKNRAAREALEPLEPNERPTVVTVAAIISASLVLGTVVSYVAGVELATFDDFGTKTGEAKPNILYTALSCFVLGAMAWGLWKSRYWAVLGFQTVLVLIIVGTVLALVVAQDLLRGLALFAVLAGASVLFYRMVKAMARIQMPGRDAPGR